MNHEHGGPGMALIVIAMGAMGAMQGMMGDGARHGKMQKMGPEKRQQMQAHMHAQESMGQDE